MVVIGDSNTARMLWQLAGVSGCKRVEPSQAAWASGEVCLNSDINLKMSFLPHGFPTFPEPSRALRYGNVVQLIDALSQNSKVVLVLHYSFRPMLSHLSIMHARLTSVRDAVKRLLTRNSDALVAVRGPHVYRKHLTNEHALRGDSLGPHYIEIIHEVFKNLQDRIVFLDGWDMTVALENPNSQPADRVPFEMMRTVLSFRCNATGGYVPRRKK